MNTKPKTAGWSTSWEDFLNTPEAQFLEALEQFYKDLPWTQQLDPAQYRSWCHEYKVMQATLRDVLRKTNITPSSCWIAFEQELAGEAGKRAADVNLILPSGHLFVIEFKHKTQASEHEIWRAAFDLETLLKFHSESINLEGHVFLALTAPRAQAFSDSKVVCDLPDQQDVLPQLHQALVSALKDPEYYKTDRWQHGEFHRQPSILAGTVEVFFNENIPSLHTEAGENINEARDILLGIYQEAKRKQQRYVVLVGGSPGAGKTLLGITATAALVKDRKSVV